MSTPTEMPVEQLKKLYAELDTADNKGKALETFCAVFFDALPGVAVTGRNLHDDAHSQELDLVLDNNAHPDGLDFVKTFVFVEAKNWKTPVGSAEVAWLDWKIRMSGIATDGVLVVANGVTGKAEDRTSAWAILRWANTEDRRIFVISPSEMVKCATAEDVRQLFKLKWRRLATGNSPLDHAEVRSL